MRSLPNIRTVVIVLAVFLVAAPCRAATVVSGANGYTVTVYSNLFAGATETEGGTLSSSKAGLADYSAANFYFGRLQNNSSNVFDGYMQLKRSSSVSIGTLITYRPVTGGSAGSMGNANVWLGGTLVQNLPDGKSNCKIVATNFAPIVTDTLKITYTNGLGFYGSGTIYISDMFEVLAFGQVMTQVHPTVPSSSPLFFSRGRATVDDLLNNAWMPQGTNSTPSAYTDSRYIEFTFTKSLNLSAIIISFDTDAMFAGETLNLRTWNGTGWTTFGTVSGTAGSGILPLQVNLKTDHVRFDMGVGRQWRGIQEVTFFFVVPPPSGTVILIH